jgi:small ligand-binding sensory domain FIST
VTDATVARYAAAISEHPVPAHAVGEIAGELLEQLDGASPDLLVVFVSPHFAGATEDVAAVFGEVLRPGAFIGATHSAVVGPGREVEDGPSISAWAASLVATTVRTVALDVVTTADGPELVGRPEDLAGAHSLMVLADPYTVPVDEFLLAVEHASPGLPVVGGLASAASGPGGNRLIADGRVRTGGVVGVVLAGGAPVTTVVSQGCRPVGRPFTVTAVDGPYLVGLGGRPALDRLQELAAGMDEEERDRLSGGLHLGIVVDEHRAEFERGDFLVRGVVGARTEDGALAVGGPVAVGRTVQFHVRDPAAADADLRSLLAGHRAGAALLFTCTGRGRRFFGSPDRDVSALADLLGPVPVAGAFCAGEIGPVGATNHVHGFTACVALFP